jgi:hypothetical protein
VTSRGILDWERRHLESVSKTHGLHTVFISRDRSDYLQQVPRPSWYPYEGLEAPLGTFIYGCTGEKSGNSYRMMPAEEADESSIQQDKKRLVGWWRRM